MSKERSNRRIWGIRAGKGGKAHEIFIEACVIALSDAAMGDLSKLDDTRDAFYARYRKSHPDDTRTGSAGIGGKYFRFVHEVHVGDLIAYPAIADKTVYVGEVTGTYLFEKSSQYPHQRRLEWKYAIPKAEFSAPARYELGAARTFFEFKKNLTELIKKIESGRYAFRTSKTSIPSHD
jgi:predicted Mrr-cat superfamily restriction endonuclease